eukprot:1285294-Amphidinium_carterae.1
MCRANAQNMRQSCRRRRYQTKLDERQQRQPRILVRCGDSKQAFLALARNLANKLYQIQEIDHETHTVHAKVFSKPLQN